MGYDYDKDLVDYFRYLHEWKEWTQQEPSLKHPIKYIKWYFSEPKFETWRKKNK